MASKALLVLAYIVCTVSVILSVPQNHVLQLEQPGEPVVQVKPEESVPERPILDADQVLQLSPRALQNLFNLSAYLAGAPANSAALNFVPLITLLAAKG